VPKGKRFSDVEDVKFMWLRPKRWEHCKELEGDYFEKF
jgi:hypothetical protein